MFLLLLVLCLFALHKARISANNLDYLGMDETTAIKGFFIGLVFLSHMQAYLNLSAIGKADHFAVTIIGAVGQLMVAYFFFCSGYGVLISYSTKNGYENTFLRKRVLKTLIHFDAAILLYLLLSVIIGKQYEARHYILCWIGWESIGNSNWFIFTSLVLYLITWLAFTIRRKTACSILNLIIIVCLGCCGLWIILYYTKKSYWDNTLFCYPLGMFIGVYKERIDKVCAQRSIYYIMLFVVAAVFIGLYRISNQIAYSFCAMTFCILIMLVSMKVKVQSPVLMWMGKHLFQLYIVQRIPMIVLDHMKVSNQYIFGTASIIGTVLLAMLFRAGTNKIDELL